MSDLPQLGVDAVDLLLSIAETPGMAISATALDEFHEAGAALITAGALRLDGFEAVTTLQADHDDAVVGLSWSNELSGYAYFSPTAGLVRVDDDRLRRYKIDISWFLRWIASSLGFATSARSVYLIPDRLWNLGDIWLGETKRTRRRTAIYLARRLTEPETITQLAAVLCQHSTRPGKVILSTTTHLDLARTVISDTCAVLAIENCARAGIENFEIDPSIIYSAAHGLRTSHSKSTIQADADFRIIRIGGREFRFRGGKQRQVVGLLYRRWQNGQGPISIAVLFEELEWPNTRRLRDLFKGHPDWQELIGHKDGACWLRCDEFLAEAEEGAGAPG